MNIRRSAVDERADRRIAATELCVGIVVIPHHEYAELARRALLQSGLVELGEASSHRIPAMFCCHVGEDRRILAELEALPAVLRVDIVCVQTLPEESCR